MISYRPPQQQVSSLHLAMSMVLLFLTVYPYLFNPNSICGSVAAYSGDDLDLKHHYIERFDIIQSGDITWSKTVSIRNTDEQLLHKRFSNQPDEAEDVSDTPQIDTTNEVEDAILLPKHLPIRKVHFSSLGRRFNLVLTKPSHLVTQDFNVISLDSEGKATKVPFNRDDIEVLDGFVKGYSESKATASFDRNEKLMTAQIKIGQETIIVEPTYLHKDSLRQTTSNINNYNSDSGDISSNDSIYTKNPKLYDDTMIVYNLRDHKQFNLNNTDKGQNQFTPTEPLCASLNMNDYNDYIASTSSKGSSSSKEVPVDPELESIFKIYKPSSKDSSSMKKHDRLMRAKRSIEYLTADPSRDKTRCTLHLVADYLFYKNVGNGDLQTTINYLLALINRVNQIYLSTQWETGEDGETTGAGRMSNIGFTVQNITIHQDFTRLSSGEQHYNMQGDKVWGAREFLDNFSRYSPPRHYCLAHLLTYRPFDSPVLGLAYVASTRYGTIGGICSPTQQKGDLYFKHNTGISTSKGIRGETLITRQADLVVAHELGHNLGAEHDSNECRPDPYNGGAFLMHPFAVMGFEKNNRVLSNCSRLAIGRVVRRKASTCFVGVVDNVCGNGLVEGDEECDGGDFGHGHNDPCCDSSCRLTPGSQCSDRHSWCCSKCHIMIAGFPCKPAEEFNCKQASYCDGSSAECPASQPVEDNKSCVGRGLCRGGDCIPFCEARGLHSCLCNNPSNACKLCCKSSINGTCTPFDTRAPYLPDGVLCFRGVCEKGRCEQPIQDVVERLWDVIEDINFTTLVKFLRDNIIFVVLVVSIPIWCLFSHYINEFDRRIRDDFMNEIMRRRKKGPPSPFLPTIFVGNEPSYSGVEDMGQLDDGELQEPLKPPHMQPLPPPHQQQRQQPPPIGFLDQFGTARNGGGNSPSLETNL